MISGEDEDGNVIEGQEPDLEDFQRDAFARRSFSDGLFGIRNENDNKFTTTNTNAKAQKLFGGAAKEHGPSPSAESSFNGDSASEEGDISTPPRGQETPQHPRQIIRGPIEETTREIELRQIEMEELQRGVQQRLALGANNSAGTTSGGRARLLSKMDLDEFNPLNMTSFSSSKSNFSSTATARPSGPPPSAVSPRTSSALMSAAGAPPPSTVSDDVSGSLVLAAPPPSLISGVSAGRGSSTTTSSSQQLVMKKKMK